MKIRFKFQRNMKDGAVGWRKKRTLNKTGGLLPRAYSLMVDMNAWNHVIFNGVMNNVPSTFAYKTNGSAMNSEDFSWIWRYRGVRYAKLVWFGQSPLRVQSNLNIVGAFNESAKNNGGGFLVFWVDADGVWMISWYNERKTR